ncbi:MAG: 3'-5' exonuclease [Bacteroidales bacterium]|jgi:DNA polymerase-3 subunit epsilon
MALTLLKPLTFFDLETTGVSPATDRIVEISIVKYVSGSSKKVVTLRVNPTIPIPPEATAIHGISNEDVADEPTFRDVAQDVFDLMKDSDLAGYNILRFDLPMLVEEMHRAGIHNFPMADAKLVDALAIFNAYEKRDLTAALKFYCDKDMENAHSAEADTLATADVLRAQIARYSLDGGIEQLQEISLQGKEVIDYAGSFTRDENGNIVFSFGKNKGMRVVKNRDYVSWMLSNDFTSDTKRKAKLILSGELK